MVTPVTLGPERSDRLEISVTSRTRTHQEDNPPTPTGDDEGQGGGHGGNATPAEPTDTYDASKDVFLVIARHRDGRQTTEIHTGETVQSYVGSLTYGSKQHRAQCERDEIELPEGGGSHEINRRDIRVLKLDTTEVTKF
jgi:hypothetical protein